MLLSSLTGCQENILVGPDTEDDANIIHVDGIDLSGAISITSSVTTRATTPVDAETIDWLLPPLKDGLDITYGKVANTDADRQESVAILRLEDSNPSITNPDYDKEGEYAVYTFNLRGADGKRTDTPAKWRGNGAHYFEGLYVPQQIRYTDNVNEIENSGKAPKLATDQSDINYTHLSHFLGMAANTRLSATIERVKLPFRHRLAHVMAFILIDPVLGGAKIEGYRGKQHNEAIEDPKTSEIYFRNVRILRGVKDEYNETTKLHTLTPLWGDKEARITPHFDGDKGSLDPDKKPRKLQLAGTEISYEENFILYINNDVTSTSDNANIYPSSDKWPAANKAWETEYKNAYASAEGEDAEKKTIATNEANSKSGYTRVEYGKVPVYDIIVRPTYSDASTVMYDEDLSGISGNDEDAKKKNLAALKNQIDFDITLDNGLQYTKEFEFDLDANHETMVFLRISREKVDYNDSGSALWITDEKNDGWYGLNNKNGNTLSKAGSSWQRAYTYGKEVPETPGTVSGVTDGQFYDATNTHEEKENAQYFNTTEEHTRIWIEKFLQAYQGGKHHGDYFALRENITIDASLIPMDFVFTGHLDAQDYTITLNGTGEWVSCTNEVLSKLKEKTGSTDTDEDYTDVPQLYGLHERAQAHPITRSDIPYGTPKELPMESITPADLTELSGKGVTILYKDNEEYKVYTNRSFYKKTGSYLFDGLNGKYTTIQETDASATVWEANVHKETNDWGTTKTHWVPTMGYRAETLNVKMASGNMLFKEGASITGNVQNCWNGDSKIPNVTPDLPDYK